MDSSVPRSYLLKLPTEIRLMILSHVLVFDLTINLDNYICSHTAKTNYGHLETSVLRVCRTLKAEASTIIYPRQTFSISERQLCNVKTSPNMRDLRHFFLARIGEDNAKTIRYLMIDTSRIKTMFRELRFHGPKFLTGLEVLGIHFIYKPEGTRNKKYELFLGAKTFCSSHPILSQLIFCGHSTRDRSRWHILEKYRCCFFENWADEQTRPCNYHIFPCETYKFVAQGSALQPGESVVDLESSIKDEHDRLEWLESI